MIDNFLIRTVMVGIGSAMFAFICAVLFPLNLVDLFLRTFEVAEIILLMFLAIEVAERIGRR